MLKHNRRRFPQPFATCKSPQSFRLQLIALMTNGCRCGGDRSKAASTLAEVLSGIQEGRSGYKGEAFKQAVEEACGWGAAGGDGPLLEIVRSRVEVRAWWLSRCRIRIKYVNNTYVVSPPSLLVSLSNRSRRGSHLRPTYVYV